jgi:hypothetical protein
MKPEARSQKPEAARRQLLTVFYIPILELLLHQLPQLLLLTLISQVLPLELSHPRS